MAPLLLLDFYKMIILCVLMFRLHVCLCTMHMPGALGGQNRTADPLELKLHMVMHYHVGVLGIELGYIK